MAKKAEPGQNAEAAAQQPPAAPQAQPEIVAEQPPEVVGDREENLIDHFLKLEADLNSEIKSYLCLQHVQGIFDQRLINIGKTQIEIGFAMILKALMIAEAEQGEQK